MMPKQKSRQPIDRQLEQAGWIVQDYRRMNITAGLCVAVREFPLTTGFSDYMLYADAKAIGCVEAKPEGFGLMGVAEQSTKYSVGLPKMPPNWEVPLPFAYESTGVECRFTDHAHRKILAGLGATPIAWKQSGTGWNGSAVVWISENFNANKTTKEMKKGLSNWSSMR
jgi:type I site-specific restriction endonuclease